jgi:hypothetical protein
MYSKHFDFLENHHANDAFQTIEKHVSTTKDKCCDLLLSTYFQCYLHRQCEQS